MQRMVLLAVMSILLFTRCGSDAPVAGGAGAGGAGTGMGGNGGAGSRTTSGPDVGPGDPSGPGGVPRPTSCSHTFWRCQDGRMVQSSCDPCASPFSVDCDMPDGHIECGSGTCAFPTRGETCGGLQDGGVRDGGARDGATAGDGGARDGSPAPACSSATTYLGACSTDGERCAYRGDPPWCTSGTLICQSARWVWDGIHGDGCPLDGGTSADASPRD